MADSTLEKYDYSIRLMNQLPVASPTLPGMAHRKPPPRPFRCRAMMLDGSVVVLFGQTARPETALELVRELFAGPSQSDKPTKSSSPYPRREMLQEGLGVEDWEKLAKIAEFAARFTSGFATYLLGDDMN